jgi:hypothetical protein
MGEFCLLYLLCMLPFPVPQTLYSRGNDGLVHWPSTGQKHNTVALTVLDLCRLCCLSFNAPFVSQLCTAWLVVATSWLQQGPSRRDQLRVHRHVMAVLSDWLTAVLTEGRDLRFLQSI